MGFFFAGSTFLGFFAFFSERHVQAAQKPSEKKAKKPKKVLPAKKKPTEIQEKKAKQVRKAPKTAKPLKKAEKKAKPVRKAAKAAKPAKPVKKAEKKSGAKSVQKRKGKETVAK